MEDSRLAPNDLNSKLNSLTSCIEEIKENYNSMKQDFIDFMPVIKDFKGLLQRKPLFDRSTFVYLNPLAKEIKSEVLREVASKLIGPTEELKVLKNEVSIQLENLSEKTVLFNSYFDLLTQENKKIKDDALVINDNLDIIQRNLDDAREDLMLKAPYHEITKLVEKIATKATVDDLNALKQQVENCPSSEQVEKLYQEIEKLNTKMRNFASKDMVKEIEVDLMVNVENKIEQFVSSKTLKDEIDRVLSIIRDANVGIEILKNRQEKFSNSYRKEVDKIQKLLLTRPWTKDIEIVSAFIDEKTNRKDFEKFKSDITPQIEFFDQKVNLFNKRIEGFDRVLERYDEIILDKASKDDVSEIKDILPKMLMSIDFEYFKQVDSKQKELLEEKITMSQSSVQEIDEQIKKFNNNYKNFKIQIKDFVTKYNSIKDLEYLLDSKADKSDIYAMFDYTARREEVKLATQSIEVLHKQLEMIVMFQLVSVKTMLKTSESAAMKNRQRNEVYTNLNCLMEWISHSVPPEIDKILDSARSVLNFSQKKPNTQDFEDSSEPMLPLLSQNRKYKRNAISLTPAPHKSATEL
jgi:hypothetical protein